MLLMLMTEPALRGCPTQAHSHTRSLISHSKWSSQVARRNNTTSLRRQEGLGPTCEPEAQSRAESICATEVPPYGVGRPA